MLGKFGFSYVGLVFLILLFIPNLLWMKYQPKGYSSENENKVLLVFERVGEVLTVCSALIFKDPFIGEASIYSLFLFASFLFMICYECWWIKYFKSEKHLSDFYSSFLGIPVAGATLPVLAFLSFGIYKKSIFIIISSLILGIGHIGIHIEHLKQIK